MKGLGAFEEVTATDHELAAWLRNNGWGNGYHQVSTATYYHGAAPGETLAVVFYDNTKCTRKIFLRPGGKATLPAAKGGLQ